MDWEKTADSNGVLTILPHSPAIFPPLAQTFASVIAMKEVCVVTELRVVSLVSPRSFNAEKLDLNDLGVFNSTALLKNIE